MRRGAFNSMVRRRWAGLIALTAGLLLTQPQAQTLDSILNMAAGGTPGLALSLMDQTQPSAEQDVQAWMRWERRRIAILGEWSQWQAAADRLAALPVTVTPAFKRWAGGQRAWFWLQLEDPLAARRELRALLWQAPGEVDPREISAWRRLLVRSYLVEARPEDALTAMTRYQQDYRDDSKQWAELSVRVLLQVRRAAQALEIFPVEQVENAPPLALQVWLDSAALSTTAIHQAAVAAAQRDGVEPVAQYRYWLVAARAAQLQGQFEQATHALERAAANLRSDADQIFSLGPDELWRSYRDLGERIGNRLQLLLGDDASWFTAAEAAASPLQARALLAVLTDKAATTAARERAHAKFAESLVEETAGIRVLHLLYLGEDTHQEFATIPPVIRYLLVEHALSENNIELASGLLATLDSAPSGVEDFDWGLRRARVLVMGGRLQEGAAIVEQLLPEEVSLAPDYLDRLLQVVFDLQAAGAHRTALAVFAKIMQTPLPVSRRRELLFWQAESWQALDEHTRAAQDYMQSATLGESGGRDEWGQTARYQAAVALADGGLVDDARRLYETLLQATENPRRQAQLRQRLQQLWLRAPATNNVAIPAHR